MRLSTNFLVSRIASIYIDIFRNIPLLVLLIFWAQAVFLKLPRVAEAIILPGPIFLSNRGVAIPWGIPTDSWGTFLVVLGAGIVLGAVVSYFLREQGKRTGRMPLITLWFLVTVAAVGLVGWIVLPQPVTLDQPFLEGFNTKGGKILSQQFMALLSGLIIYTAAFIAEVVRAGIQSVSKGQREAATSLGLNPAQTPAPYHFPPGLAGHHPAAHQPVPEPDQELLSGYRHRLSRPVRRRRQHDSQPDRSRNRNVYHDHGHLPVTQPADLLLMNIYNRRIRLVER